MTDWKKDLRKQLKTQKFSKKEIEKRETDGRKRAKRFIRKTVLPAFASLEKEMQKFKRVGQIDNKKYWAAFLVRKKKKKEFIYEISFFSKDGELVAGKRMYKLNKKGKMKLFGEGKIRGAKKSNMIEKIKAEHIISDFHSHYKKVDGN